MNEYWEVIQCCMGNCTGHNTCHLQLAIRNDKESWTNYLLTLSSDRVVIGSATSGKCVYHCFYLYFIICTILFIIIILITHLGEKGKNLELPILLQEALHCGAGEIGFSSNYLRKQWIHTWIRWWLNLEWIFIPNISAIQGMEFIGVILPNFH